LTRFGILGCGSHGTRYLAHLAGGDVPGAQAVGLWRRDARAAADLAGRYGVRALEGWEALIADPEVDALVVATPPGLHPEAILAAALAGKPVLAEKPLAASLVQALELAAALPTDARVMVAQTLRWSPVLVETRARLAELGEIHRLRLAQRLEPNALPWQRDRRLAGGGALTLTGVHGFDLVRWLLGATPALVSARALPLLDHPFESLFEARFEYRDPPLLASCEVSKHSASRSALLELVGTRGQLWADYQAGRLELLQGRDRRIVAEPGDRPTIPPTLSAFCRWVELGGQCPVPIEDGIETLRMADACCRSSALGGAPVAVAEPPAG
jgi:predicted dehydrogenase